MFSKRILVVVKLRFKQGDICLVSGFVVLLLLDDVDDGFNNVKFWFML